jgi:tyrosinase
MARTRVNVYVGAKWADPVLWYAKGVAAMQARPLKDPTSWGFWAAMHGFDAGLWQALGYLHPGEARPAAAVVKRFWNQCQHGSWYFLPWHRGYLLAFERVVRAAVVDQGGPSTWALPYWNPFVHGQAKLPPAFASHTWPGQGPNPLFVSHRYGPHDDGNVFVPATDVNLKALQRRRYTGVSTGGSPGFGGVDTGFSHGGPIHGALESQPHDWIHVLVGGGDPNNPSHPGLMSDPDTAALDPIFWLHHANIDRLWEVWNRADAAHRDPTGTHWAKGPASVGDRGFEMPEPDGGTWTYTPKDVKSLHDLHYGYDDLTPAGAVPVPRVATTRGGVPVAGNAEPELVGATTEPVELRGDSVSSDVRLERSARHRVVASALRAAVHEPDTEAEAEAEGPEQVFLNLENVRGTSDTTAFQVYVGLGPDEDPDSHPELLAGSIAPFGVRKASQPDGEHVGQGLTFVLDITDVVQHLHLNSSFDVDQLPVRLIPLHPVRAGADITVGRISIYRHAD